LIDTGWPLSSGVTGANQGAIAVRPPRTRRDRPRALLLVSGIQVARQRIQAGLSYAGQTVTIELGGTSLRVIDQHGELITTVHRNGTTEISRFKAYGTRRSS
jgi:hypothetical protein